MAKRLRDCSPTVQNQSRITTGIYQSITKTETKRAESKKQQKTREEVLSESNINKIKNGYGTANKYAIKINRKNRTKKKTEKLKKLFMKPNLKLFNLAQVDPHKAGELLQEIGIDRSAIDIFIQGFTDQVNNPTMLADIIIGATSKDIDSLSDSKNLLGESDTSSKLLKAYINKFIAPAFEESEELKTLLNNIPKKNLLKPPTKKKLKTIVNKAGRFKSPRKLAEGSQEVIEDFVGQFFDMSSTVMTDNKNNPDFQNFHRICHAASVMGNTKFGDSSGSTVAGNFLFLNKLNAMVLNPNKQGVKGIKFSASQQENAKQMLIVLTILVNNSTEKFKEQEYLKGFMKYAEKTGLPKAQEVRDQIITSTAEVPIKYLIHFQKKWKLLDVFNNKPLFNAMKTYLMKTFQDDPILFMEALEEGKNKNPDELQKYYSDLIDDYFKEDTGSLYDTKGHALNVTFESLKKAEKVRKELDKYLGKKPPDIEGFNTRLYKIIKNFQLCNANGLFNFLRHQKCCITSLTSKAV